MNSPVRKLLGGEIRSMTQPELQFSPNGAQTHVEQTSPLKSKIKGCQPLWCFLPSHAGQGQDRNKMEEKRCEAGIALNPAKEKPLGTQMQHRNALGLEHPERGWERPLVLTHPLTDLSAAP